MIFCGIVEHQLCDSLICDNNANRKHIVAKYCCKLLLYQVLMMVYFMKE